jgi:hypothetical protein
VYWSNVGYLSGIMQEHARRLLAWAYNIARVSEVLQAKPCFQVG